MKRDVTAVLRKHVSELFGILSRYQISDQAGFTSIAETDMVFQRAVLMTVGYIGELSKKLDDGIKQANSDINWRRLSTSRNIIFHDYDIVDMHIIATVVFKDISALQAVLDTNISDS